MSETPTTYSASTDIPAFVTAQTLPRNSHACPNREAALLGLCHLKPEYLDRLLALSPGEWRKALRWLNVSGLTLNFAHQVNELGLQGSLPVAVNQCLQQNLSDNRARMRSLLQESAALQAEFQRANVSYAVVEGLSLSPTSVPMPELRHELELDFLVDERFASKVREILEQAGYGLSRNNARSWQFKKKEASSLSNDLPKNGFGHTVELHLETIVPGRESRLSRLEYREIEGITMPVLAPADLFLRQGMRVFDEVRSPFVRASHLLEFYRNVCAHGDDPVFWSEVRSRAEEDPACIFGLGVVLQLIESVMEGEVPSKLAMWTMLRLPAAAQLWVALYGKSCVYGLPPGSKLYRLLQRELERAGASFTQAGGSPRTGRSVVQWLKFHIVEGVRYGWASYRWRRYRTEVPA